MSKLIRSLLKKNTYLKNYYVQLADKLHGEIYSRYFPDIKYSFDRTILEILKFKRNRTMIPFLDLSITTYCTLNCRDCTQWTPYLPKEMPSARVIISELDALFDKIDSVMFISPLGGEAFMHPEFAQILEYLIQKQRERKIKYIRIVTNGTIVPTGEVIEKLKSENIFVLISNYTSILTANQLKNRNELVKMFETNLIKYYLVEKEFKWTDLGQPHYGNKTLDILEETYRTCFVRDCVGWYGGKIYKCPRQYYVEKKYDIIIDTESINYKQIPKRKIKNCIHNFYCIARLEACQYCANKEERKSVSPAIQIIQR